MNTAQITGLFLKGISALDGNSANFITFPHLLKGQPVISCVESLPLQLPG